MFKCRCVKYVAGEHAHTNTSSSSLEINQEILSISIQREVSEHICQLPQFHWVIPSAHSLTLGGKISLIKVKKKKKRNM